VVVTERKWVHLIKSLDIDQAYDVVVISSLADLIPVLVGGRKTRPT
jgi:hypothetical protein